MEKRIHIGPAPDLGHLVEARRAHSISAPQDWQPAWTSISRRLEDAIDTRAKRPCDRRRKKGPGWLCGQPTGPSDREKPALPVVGLSVALRQRWCLRFTIPVKQPEACPGTRKSGCGRRLRRRLARIIHERGAGFPTCLKYGRLGNLPHIGQPPAMPMNNPGWRCLGLQSPSDTPPTISHCRTPLSNLKGACTSRVFADDVPNSRNPPQGAIASARTAFCATTYAKQVRTRSWNIPGRSL